MCRLSDLRICGYDERRNNIHGDMAQYDRGQRPIRFVTLGQALLHGENGEGYSCDGGQDLPCPFFSPLGAWN